MRFKSVYCLSLLLLPLYRRLPLRPFLSSSQVEQPLILPSCRYLWLYIIILKDFLVYVSDIFTAVTMLSTDAWSNQIFNSCPEDHANGCVYIPFSIAKWLFFGCIIFSFLLVRSSARHVRVYAETVLSSHMKVIRQRRSLQVVTFLMHSPMSWRTTTIL